jgi:hypothetical protein
VKNIADGGTWGLVVLLCLTLGLAPYNPPHVVEKLRLLAAGDLTKPMDWIDLCLHGAPWVLLAAKVLIFRRNR